MAIGYTKLFNSILHSTIWGESNETRLIWITMLAMSDRDGVVSASIPGLARAANVSIQDAETAVKCLLSPDKYSRTPDHEGRRIEPVDGGWVLLNHAKYREKMNQEERREYNRLKKKEGREKAARLENIIQKEKSDEEEHRAKMSNNVNDTSMTVNDIPPLSALSAHSDSDSNSSSNPLSKKKEAQAPVAIAPPLLPHGDNFREAWSDWEAHRKEIKKPLKPTQTAAQLKQLAAIPEAEAIAMIRHTVAMGWQGLRAPDPPKPNGRPATGTAQGYQLPRI